MSIQSTSDGDNLRLEGPQTINASTCHSYATTKSDSRSRSQQPSNRNFATSTPISTARALASALTISDNHPNEYPVGQTAFQVGGELDEKPGVMVVEEAIPCKRWRVSSLPPEVPAPASQDPFGFVCAFGFNGNFDEPAVVPDTKGTFLSAIVAEIEAVDTIQTGLLSYQQAINSREHNTFSVQFLINQNTATVVTLDQLDQIATHLKELIKEVQQIEQDDGRIKQALMDAFCHAKSWINRTRAILRHSHVFYKINFVLASNQTTKRAIR